jgi:alkaline phosphatase D
MKKLAFLFWAMMFTVSLAAQSLFNAAPMLGHVDMKEIKILLNSTKECDYRVDYWPSMNKAERKSIKGGILDGEFLTQVITLSNLEPATQYGYEVTLSKDGVEEKYTKFGELSFKTEALWQWRTDAPDFSFTTGSCAFINEEKYDRPGKPYGNTYEIFEAIAKQRPDFMLWLGDNVYLREVDFESKASMVRRYQLMRALPQIQQLLTVCPHYAIWDDHDFGPNDSNGSFIHKDWTTEIFKEYWANSSYGIDGEGITGHFAYADAEFFLLDNRYHKTLPIIGEDKGTILGASQIGWLKQALLSSKSRFKFIAMGGQFLNTEAKFENYSTYPDERQMLIDFIEKNNIKGVIFLSGDRHCTELSALKLANGNMIYDLTASPLTSGAYDNTKENNTLRVEGTVVSNQNFALIRISGDKANRAVEIIINDSAGKEVWKRKLEGN